MLTAAMVALWTSTALAAATSTAAAAAARSARAEESLLTPRGLVSWRIGPDGGQLDTHRLDSATSYSSPIEVLETFTLYIYEQSFSQTCTGLHP